MLHYVGCVLLVMGSIVVSRSSNRSDYIYCLCSFLHAAEIVYTDGALSHIGYYAALVLCGHLVHLASESLQHHRGSWCGYLQHWRVSLSPLPTVLLSFLLFISLPLVNSCYAWLIVYSHIHVCRQQTGSESSETEIVIV